MIVTAPAARVRRRPRWPAALGEATGLPVRVLTRRERGPPRLRRAPSRGRPASCPEVVAVVDVGGGSTEIAVGTPLLGAAWIRSADLGSLRLTRAHLR